MGTFHKYAVLFIVEPGHLWVASLLTSYLGL